jgi:uncharacterized protein YndB with AHSA1/START domain
MQEVMREFAHSLVIDAPPAAVLDAFFDSAALASWWQVTRSVCIARPLGSYALEWAPTDWRDDLLGRLGGAFHATVMEYQPGREFFLADAYWLPPDGDPIGPMALEASCSLEGDRTLLRVRQSGCDAESERWVRYYDIISSGWMLALEALKKHLEHRWGR